MSDDATPLELAALRYIDENPCFQSSSLAYGLVARGALQLRTDRGRMSPQGAGFIGGKIIAGLRRKAWIRGPFRLSGTTLTAQGHRILLEAGAVETPHAP